MCANAFQRDREHAQSSPETADFHPEAWRRMRRRGIECGASILVYGKVLCKKFPSASLDFEKQQGFESGETGAVEEAGTPRAEYQCPECAKVFLSSRARATQESRVHGKRRPALAYARDGKVSPAVLATFIREFGWSTICRTRQ